jgi:hypothetical protein
VHLVSTMSIDSAKACFETIAARGRSEHLADAVGSWEFSIEDAGTWTVTVDHGALRVSEAPSRQPTARFRLSEDELVRLARGEGHENLLTAALRGALGFEGELAFAQKLQSILPLPEEWRTET